MNIYKGQAMSINVVPHEVLDIRRVDPRLDLAVVIALKTSLRRSEVLSLDIAALLDHNGEVKKEVKVKIKGKGRWEYVHFPPALRVRIAAFIDDGIGRPLFIGDQGGRLSTSTLNRWWLEHQRNRGVEPTYRFHDLRHTAISRYYWATRDVIATKDFARHRSLLTTMLYTHINPDEFRKSIDDLEDYLEGKEKAA